MQLQDTQSSLANQFEKIQMLETVLKEQEDVRREVRGLREVVEARDVLFCTTEIAAIADHSVCSSDSLCVTGRWIIMGATKLSNWDSVGGIIKTRVLVVG